MSGPRPYTRRGPSQGQQQSAPLVPACPLYVVTREGGGRYMRGRLGGLRVLVMPKKEGEPGDRTHVLLIGAAPQRTGGEDGR